MEISSRTRMPTTMLRDETCDAGTRVKWEDVATKASFWKALLPCLLHFCSNRMKGLQALFRCRCTIPIQTGFTCVHLRSYKFGSRGVWPSAITSIQGSILVDERSTCSNVDHLIRSGWASTSDSINVEAPLWPWMNSRSACAD